MSSELPIHALRAAFDAAHARGPVVISSPTGSGKSTEVPRWCRGRVLVIEPRRIACRSLAARVAELEATSIGEGVGYLVRDESRAREQTRIVFATPGIVLRHRALIEGAGTIVLDEVHERSLEIDLLLALLLRMQRAPSLVVMSATIEGERVARHVGGEHLAAQGRTYPVEIRHLAEGGVVLPDTPDLALRVRRALDTIADDPGDVLVFLPGKAEIEACSQALRSAPWSIVTLHGGLELDEQRRAFERTPRRKVILATNVAETSLTIPGVGVVIDAGLVRQTRYQDGRGFLALVPIAGDSAAQRAGRAGRTGPGVCVRLWSPAAKLAEVTPPEIHRESLVSLVIAAAAWGERAEDLPLLDAPRPHALDAARAELRAWGALEGARLSDAGRALFALPLDPLHARILVAARDAGCVADVIDLVAALSVGRPLFVAGPRDAQGADPRESGCDVTAIIRAVREGDTDDPTLSSFVLREARLARTRLRRAEGLADTRPAAGPIDRDAIVRAAITADPRVVHVARSRGRVTYFSNGGTEIELGRESAVSRVRAVEALVVLDTHALGAGRDARVLVTCGMAIPLAVIARAGLGTDRLGGVSLERGRAIATIERTYAGRAIAEREETPVGPLAREAIATLIERGSLFKGAAATTRERLGRAALAAALASRGHSLAAMVAGARADAPTELRAWLLARLEALGVESGDDVAMLSAADVIAPELPYEVREVLDRELPGTVSVGDASYRAEYDLEARQVILHMVRGSRRDPPPLAYLPKFPGLRVCVAGPRGVAVLRERG